MARMSDDVTVPIIGVAISLAVVVGLVLYGRKASAAPSPAAPGVPLPTIIPAGFLPGLKVGDSVVVDTAAANIPPPSNVVPFLVCAVDMILSDPTLVSVRAVGAPFGGTIPRVAIVKVLPTLPGDLQT